MALDNAVGSSVEQSYCNSLDYAAALLLAAVAPRSVLRSLDTPRLSLCPAKDMFLLIFQEGVPFGYFGKSLPGHDMPVGGDIVQGIEAISFSLSRCDLFELAMNIF